MLIRKEITDKDIDEKGKEVQIAMCSGLHVYTNLGQVKQTSGIIIALIFILCRIIRATRSR